MKRRTRWVECPCGRAFRSYSHDRCEDCREGRRAARLSYRASLRGPSGAGSRLRLFQQRAGGGR